MTRKQALKYCYSMPNSSISFIANVIAEGSTDTARKLKALAKLHTEGHDIHTASFVMPYDGILIDGRFVSLNEMVGMAGLKK